MKTTPEDFKKKMQDIANECGGDPEIAHVAMDDLMEEMLTELGYGEGVAIFSEQEKWYG